MPGNNLFNLSSVATFSLNRLSNSSISVFRGGGSWGGCDGNPPLLSSSLSLHGCKLALDAFNFCSLSLISISLIGGALFKYFLTDSSVKTPLSTLPVKLPILGIWASNLDLSLKAIS